MRITRIAIVLFTVFSSWNVCFGQLMADAEKEKKENQDGRIIKYGIASFYAKKFEGRKTYTDKVYDGKLLTAACNVLPMGTWVKVTNLKNHKSVIVEINDHLARKNKRLIDLTYRAAKELKYTSQGIARVSVEVIDHKQVKHARKKVHKHKKHPGKKHHHKKKHKSQK